METAYNIPPTEALVEAIGYAANRFHDPTSLAYKLRSPLLLQSFAVPGKHIINQDGLRVFPSNVSGYKAAVFDMALKIAGNSRARLQLTDKLVNLLGVYRVKSPEQIRAVVAFLRLALEDESISESTPLSRFSETPHHG